MQPGDWLAFAALLSTSIAGFAAVLVRLGRLSQRLDLLWDWYLREIGPPIVGGRRRYDPPAIASADEDDDNGSPAAA